MSFDPSSTNEYYDRKFTDLVYENQRVEFIEFHDCVFIACSFQETHFKGCKFYNCRFLDCNLSLVNLEGTSFSRTHFGGSQLVGINWALADLSGKALLRPFDFNNCVLNYSIFIGADLKEVQFVRCVAKDVDFSDANMKRVDASESDFTGSRFVNTDLTEADFSRAVNYQINAAQNTLKGTKFSLPEAISLLRSLDIELVE